MQVLLQLSLSERDPFKFVSYAEDFAKSLEEKLSQGDDFSEVGVRILGAAEKDTGIS